MNNTDKILRINELIRIAHTGAHNANVFAKRLRPKSIANAATTNSIHMNIGNCIACCSKIAKIMMQLQ